MSNAMPFENRIVVENGQDPVARAVLLILDAITAQGGDDEPRVWRFASGPSALSNREATEYLSRMRKPVVCEIAQGKAEVAVKCGHPDENPKWQWWTETMQDGGGWLSPTEQDEMDRTGKRSILLVGDEESIVLSEDEAKRLKQDYIILGNHTTTSFTASRLDPALDVAVVWRYWSSSSVTSVEVV